jgi:uncharacterized peroxidase-related enzyme
MATLKVHTIASAPEGSRHSLEEVQQRLGNIPNLYGTLANSPELLNGYMALNHQWERTSLTAKERELIFLSASVANQCPYCTAGYTAGLQQMHTGGDIIRQVLYNETVQDPRINALVTLVKELVNNRGFISDHVRTAFIEAGYEESVILEILVGVAMKTMANYLDHIFPIPIDKAYQDEYNAVIREVHE